MQRFIERPAGRFTRRPLTGVGLLVSLIGILLLAGCGVRPQDDIVSVSQFAPPAANSAQSGTVVRLVVTPGQINAGDTTTVQIQIDNVTNLTAADVQVSFDPAVLQGVDANDQQTGIQLQPGNLLTPDFIVTNNIDNATGLAQYALAQFGTTPPVSGSGVLATITFQGVADGVSLLTFALTDLVNVDSTIIAVTTQNGQITVGQGGPDPDTPTPTNTPTLDLVGTPTETPTPTTTLAPDVTPTDTPIPTSTPLPTVTPTASPTFTPIPPVPSATAPVTILPPDGATIGFCYRVEVGETIHTIANRFSVSPKAINKVNDLSPPYHVFPQQGLFIPTIMGTGPNYYITQPGDSLAHLAYNCHLDSRMIAEVNYLEGQVVSSGVGEVDQVFEPGTALLIPIPPFPPPSRYDPFGPETFPPVPHPHGYR